MRVFGISALALTLWVGAAYGQAGGAPPAPTGKAGYFANSDIQNIWQDLEARQVLNKRVLEGGTHSINVRIVTPKDAPLVHANSLDIWLVQAGGATAVTGGELLDAKKRCRGPRSRRYRDHEVRAQSMHHAPACSNFAKSGILFSWQLGWYLWWQCNVLAGDTA